MTIIHAARRLLHRWQRRHLLLRRLSRLHHWLQLLLRLWLRLQQLLCPLLQLYQLHQWQREQLHRLFLPQFWSSVPIVLTISHSQSILTVSKKMEKVMINLFNIIWRKCERVEFWIWRRCRCTVWMWSYADGRNVVFWWFFSKTTSMSHLY